MSYWVGGSGNVSDAANHWAASSGGAPGAGNLPDSTKDAVFDANSNGGSNAAYTVTFDVDLTCKNLNFAAKPGDGLGGTITAALGTHTIFIYGNVVFLSGMTVTSDLINGRLIYESTVAGNTVTTNGIDVTGIVPQHVFRGAGGDWTLQDNYGASYSASVVVQGIGSGTGGKLITNNKTIKCSTFACNQNGIVLAGTSLFDVRAFSLSGTASGSSDYSTASINIERTTGGNGTFDGNGRTFGIVTINTTGVSSHPMTGTNTFGTLSILGNANTTNEYQLSANQTVTGTFKYAGNSAVNRLLLRSDTVGTPRTITAAAIDAASDFCDFMDITGAGAAAPFATGTSLGDCQGNSGITFTAPATQTANGTASFTWSTHGWTSRVPLPQDDVVIPNAFVAGRTITADMPRAGKSITCSCTGNPALTLTTGVVVFGGMTLSSGMAFNTAAFGCTFLGRGAYTLTTAGVPINGHFNIYAGTCTLGGALTQTSGFVLSTGNYALNPVINTADFPMTLGGFRSQGQAYTFNLGASLVTIISNGDGSGTWAANAIDTINAGTSTIKITDATVATKTFAGGGKTYNKVWYSPGAGIGTFQVTGNNTFADFKDDGSAAHTVQFAAGSTQHVGAWHVSGPGGASTKFGWGPGASGSYFSTPNAAANQITGDLDIRAQVAFNDWTTLVNGCIAAKRTGNTYATAAWAFTLDASVAGRLTLFRYNSAGTPEFIRSSVVTGFAAGSKHWVRVTRSASTGNTIFYTCPSEDGVTWVQLGTTQTSTAEGQAVTTDPVEAGSQFNGTSLSIAGALYRFMLLNGINGAVAVDFNPDASYTSGTTWTAATGEVWTINGAALVNATDKIALGSTTGAAWNLVKDGGGSPASEFISISDCAASGASWRAGSVSIDGGGNSGWTFTHAASVFQSAPVAKGSWGTKFAFTDASPFAPTTWLWDFGDGTTSTEQNPTHTFGAGGPYTVTFTASYGTMIGTPVTDGFPAVSISYPDSALAVDFGAPFEIEDAVVVDVADVLAAGTGLMIPAPFRIAKASFSTEAGVVAAADARQLVTVHRIAPAFVETRAENDVSGLVKLDDPELRSLVSLLEKFP